ncbi:hypothetical protein BBP40_011843 [Aspergillus hancockii]|nr:hypothetical protein BBP40_011843 [Aspergillus hancockii]
MQSSFATSEIELLTIPETYIPPGREFQNNPTFTQEAEAQSIVPHLSLSFPSPVGQQPPWSTLAAAQAHGLLHDPSHLPPWGPNLSSSVQPQSPYYNSRSFFTRIYTLKGLLNPETLKPNSAIGLDTHFTRESLEGFPPVLPSASDLWRCRYQVTFACPIGN